MPFESELLALLTAQSLNEKQAYRIFSRIFEQTLETAETKNFLLLLAKKGESSGELSGCLKALRRLEPPAKPSIPQLMDTCGTGGDGSHSINVSTLAALVIAGAGGKVAKHGNRGISSKCGSSDLLEALGVKLDAPKERMIESIHRFGIGYFHAPFYHPVFSKMQPLRRAIKTRTIFNLLGPLANPLGVKIQLIGVARSELVSLFAETLAKDEAISALICHSRDGLDEISVLKPTQYALVRQGKIKYGVIRPGALGFHHRSLEQKGGDVAANSKLARKILEGKLKGALRDWVVLNAAAGLWISGKSKNLRDGMRLAEDSLDSGKALRALEGLIRISCPQS